MGGSKSKSSSSSSTSTSTNTSNLNLDGVDGITVAGSEGITIAQTSDGAFEVVNHAISALENSQINALSEVANSSNKNIKALTEATIGSFEKINESNRTDTQQVVERITMISIAGLLAWGATKIWGSKNA
jgi:hypothetical protein